MSFTIVVVHEQSVLGGSNLASLAFSMTACTSEVGILYLISQASLKPSITSLLSALVDSSCTSALADGRMNGCFDLA